MEETKVSGKTILFGCLGTFLFILFVVTTLVGFKSVGATEIAVATRFGQVTGVRNSGVHIDPLTNYTEYDTRIQKHSTNQAAATNDLQDIQVEITVNYKIQVDKVEKIYREIGDDKQIREKVIDPIVAQTVKSIATQYGGEELIQKRQEVTKEVQSKLVEVFENKYYLDVTEVSLTNFTFTNADFNAAIDRKQIAEQEALKAKFELEQTKVQAEQQRVQKETLTPAILQKMAIEKWDGKLPQFIGNGAELPFLFKK